MKKLRFAFTIIGIVLVSITASLHAQSLKKVHSMIEERNKEMVESMIEGDFYASLPMYTEDAYSLPSYGPMIQGMEAFKEAADEMTNSSMKITSFKPVIKEIIQGGDLYVEIGTYTMSMDIEGMPDPMTDKGKYVTVWEMQNDGSLKVKVETWNSDINPWESMGM